MPKNLTPKVSSLKPAIRCAIYTRKSTDERLDLEFNSLDSQRESAEAFIKSQMAEGWVCLPKQYSDGGFSGGSLERPALNELLADIEAGQIDCAIVASSLQNSNSEEAKVTKKIRSIGRQVAVFSSQVHVCEGTRLSQVRLIPLPISISECWVVTSARFSGLGGFF